MILILTNKNDRTTDDVCSWFNYYKIKYFRLNEEDLLNAIEKLEFTDCKCKILLNNKSDNRIIDLNTITKVLFRRGGLYLFNKVGEVNKLKIDNIGKRRIEEHLQDENRVIIEFVYYFLKNKPHINDPLCYNINKLEVLYEAQKAGLNIPKTLITSKNEDLKIFSKNFKKRVITKSISDSLIVELPNKDVVFARANLVNKKDAGKDDFWYSKFQFEIDKKYDLRVFYFSGKFYSVAIFPNYNKMEGTEYENTGIDDLNLNRITPYNLPAGLKKALIKLMRKLKLESGSIDIIKDNKDEYYFLEVNPVGQLEYVSKIGNYYIEKDIANFLKYE